MKISILAIATTAILIICKTDAYCNWNGCNGVVQGGEWCNESQGQCEGGCSGSWCTNPFSYCHWGPNGDAASSTCNVETTGIQSTEWCNANQGQCETCGGRWCRNGNSTPSAPSTPTATPGPVLPTTSLASTTRYWDCSGGACGCAYLPFGPGTNDQPALCYSNAMFAAPAGNAYGATFYGTAAVSQVLGGGDWLADACGKCWKVTGTSNIPPYDGVSSTLVLKGTNYCPPNNPSCNNKAHFDIAAPGFDYLPSSFSNVCSSREPNEAAGFSSCQYWMISSSDPDQNCNCSLFNNDVLRNGCENFRTLYWDNVQVTYEEVTCPEELTRLPCWDQNGNAYPSGIPEFCASNEGSSALPTPKPVSQPTPSPVSPTPQPITPTPSPTPQPVVAPTPQPTPKPVAPPSPVSSPTPPSSGNMCCSWNFKMCGNPDSTDWCNLSKENCLACGGGSAWIEQGACGGLAKWEICTNNKTACCAPATCQKKGNYFQCL